MTETILAGARPTPAGGFDAGDRRQISPLVVWLGSSDRRTYGSRVQRARRQHQRGRAVARRSRGGQARALGPGRSSVRWLPNAVASRAPRSVRSGRRNRKTPRTRALMVWQSKIDVDSLRGDRRARARGRLGPRPRPARRRVRPATTRWRAPTQRSGVGGQTPDQTADYYRERKIACAIWGTDAGGDARRATGRGQQRRDARSGGRAQQRHA